MRAAVLAAVQQVQAGQAAPGAMAAEAQLLALFGQAQQPRCRLASGSGMCS